VLPEDVQAILPALVAHRLRLADEASPASSLATGRRIIESVPIP
jgi:hypothetical protein